MRAKLPVLPWLAMADSRRRPVERKLQSKDKRDVQRSSWNGGEAPNGDFTESKPSEQPGSVRSRRANVAPCMLTSLQWEASSKAICN